jgi:hypothetical protein
MPKYQVRTATEVVAADSFGGALKEFLDQPKATVVVTQVDDNGFRMGQRTFTVTSMPRRTRDQVLRVLSQWQNDKMTAREAVIKCLDILEGGVQNETVSSNDI